jgi:hypothetical protein
MTLSIVARRQPISTIDFASVAHTRARLNASLSQVYFGRPSPARNSIGANNRSVIRRVIEFRRHRHRRLPDRAPRVIPRIRLIEPQLLSFANSAGDERSQPGFMLRDVLPILLVLVW